MNNRTNHSVHRGRDASWLGFLTVAAFFVGLLVGWLLRGLVKRPEEKDDDRVSSLVELVKTGSLPKILLGIFIVIVVHWLAP